MALVINKIDLPAARTEDIALEVERLLGFDAAEAVFTSAKTGVGVDELLRAIVRQMPPPTGDPGGRLRALICDAKPDPHRGIISHTRVFDGTLKRGDRVGLVAVGWKYQVTEVGKYTPKPTPVDSLSAGEVGYLFAGIKTLADVSIGDTVTHSAHPTDNPLPGYAPPQQMVFCDFYPGVGCTTAQLREAMEKLWLNDSSFTCVTVSSDALGIGFRRGFLGLPHMKIIQEGLERESDIAVVETAPTVTYEILRKDGTSKRIGSPSGLPDTSEVRDIREPVVDVSMLIPAESVGPVMQLSMVRRGKHRETEYLSPTRVMLVYKMALCEVIYNL